MLPGGWELFSILARVDGYLYPHEAVFLYWLARQGPGAGDMAEIGSFRGRSTLCMAAGLRHRGHDTILAIDPHVYRTEAELRENIEHFEASRYVEPVAAPSAAAAVACRRPLRLIFIDGNHEKENVEADVRAWLPHLVPGGLLLLHDSTDLSLFAGPREVAANLRGDSSRFSSTGTIGSIHWFRLAGSSDSWKPAEYGKSWIDLILEVVTRRKNRVRSRTESL